MVIYNPIGQDPVDFADETAAKRIGNRIREIRTARGLTQTELGDKIGLSSDRIQKYENGYRKPKAEMIKAIALALDVETLALIDPVASSYQGLMYVLFELEKLYGFEIGLQDGKFVLLLEDNRSLSPTLNKYLRAWYDALSLYRWKWSMAQNKQEEAEATNQYDEFRWTFPRTLSDQTEVLLKKQQLENQIAELQKQLKSLDLD